MPYADPERQKQAQREWSRGHLSRGSEHVVQSTKYGHFFGIRRAFPGREAVMGEFANQNSASVQAWRVKQGFYGPGFDAWVRGRAVYVVYRGDVA